MSFLEPLFLAGLLAAGLPLLIHLFYKRKATRRRFPALAFLIESKQRSARSVKVKQWALLALRISAVALLALALAKPFCLSERGVTSAERMPTAVVFVLDTSASMQRDGAFAQAQRELERELQRLRPWDEIALIETTRAELLVERLDSDHGQVRRAASELTASSSAGDTLLALTRARDVLASSQLFNRRIVLISDLARGGLDLEAMARLELGQVELRLVEARRTPQADTQNLAVVEVTYTQEGSAQEHLWRIDAQVKNYGEREARQVQLELRLGQEVVAVGQLDAIAPEQVASLTFRHRVELTEPTAASVSLASQDSYALDDRYEFVFKPRARINALLVNGEPSGLAHEDEAFFVTRALNPKKASSGGVVSTVINASALGTTTLKAFDVIFLLNVPRIPADAAARLEAYVREGGGLFIAMGDQVDVEAYNQTMLGLMPRALRSLKKLADRDDPDAPVKVTRLGPTDHQHPIFRAFTTTGSDTLQSVQLYSYMLLEPAVDASSRTLISLKDDAPALLERELGKGRTLLWTTTLDYEWTDLPVSSTFVPLMQRTVLYLARRATSRGGQSLQVGQASRLELAGLAKERLIVQPPDPQRAPIVLEVEGGAVVFTPPEAGVYHVWAEQRDEQDLSANRLDDLTLAVNSPQAESDLRRLEDERWLAMTRQAPEQVAQQGTSQAARASGVTPDQRRVNLWPKLLFMVTLLLLLETMVGARRAMWRRLRERLSGRESLAASS